jgi:hypothetical protein
MARPSIFTPELGTSICERIAAGESLRAICRDEEMPSSSSVFSWLLDAEKKSFLEQYEAARAIQAELMFEELVEIADNSEHDELERESGNGGTYYVPNTEYIQRSRLRVDTRKWYLSKVLPKKFGEKLDLTSAGKAVAPIVGMRIIDDAKTDTVEGN